MWGSYPASLRNVGGSTQVPVRTWNNARKGLPPPVNFERRNMTYTVSMWRKTKNKQTYIKKIMILPLPTDKSQLNKFIIWPYYIIKPYEKHENIKITPDFWTNELQERSGWYLGMTSEFYLKHDKVRK
jgi:hypothetical protein